ncbi:hypothetical protein [Streptantibioticus cattleyicolor]|uniref:DUF4185 domain-containing protein n=1 Tax=Streptantibioticus cattleyicolor (strain ATCC 35852 / DSM 46488 / JCM 4925 / NBRC 14057 / NRRL 8057) TaxID=1003195 RepID=F8JMT4_STREN|nr:hypothetical protein [Streptantibioticus cattleyicolor]AEW99279.1 hypothetical protein SCATT_p10860 [Streptantibioticus cattleyicolor NRRL 8057 = DSM 46488]CCB71680.1 conserved exported protein of unknown function [Streptantibioticus cattleyicolor NRRL 8057 = DSM 46488]
MPFPSFAPRRRPGPDRSDGTVRRRGPSRWLTALLAAACVALPGASAPPESRQPPPAPPRIVSVRPDQALDRAFADYADHGPAAGHWTGGDSTYSVRTPRGELWIFSDTFLGTVRRDGSRAPVTGPGRTTPMVHNSFVRLDASGAHTVTGHDRAGRPASLVSPAQRDQWYWARDGLFDGQDVAVVYARYAPTGRGPLDVAWRANVLARFRPGRLSRPESVTPLPSAAGIAWGAWLARDGGRTYVYGTRAAPHGGGNLLYAARVTGSDLRAPWRFRAADGTWVPEESRAAPLDGPGGTPLHVPPEVSVVRHAGRYALLSQPQDQPFRPVLQLSWATSPTGPFDRPRTVYTAPEAGPSGSYHDRNVFVYNPHEHPELERGGAELVVSYNVNSLDPSDVIRHASIYRPRFLRIRLAP